MEAKVRFNKAIDLLKKAEYQKAMKIINELISKYPKEADFISERGVVKFHLKDLEGSLKDMDAAVKLQPNKAYRYSSRAFIRGNAGMVEKAIEDYQKAIELDPDDAIAQNNLGLLEEKLGYEEQSKRRYEIADALVKDSGIDGFKDQEILGKALEGRNIQKEINEARSDPSFWTILKSIGSKEGRSSFARFIRSGFKNT